MQLANKAAAVNAPIASRLRAGCFGRRVTELYWSLAEIVSKNAQQVIEEIECTFANVRLGGGVSLREAQLIDDYGSEEERREARSLDEALDWKNIPEAMIARYCSSLSFFDALGMRFHLPAYMCFALRHYKDSDSPSIDFTVYTLGYDDARYSSLSPEQRGAVREFLKFMAFPSEGRVLSKHARSALENVWIKKTKSSQP